MTEKIEIDGVIYHVESGHVFEEKSAFVWKEKLDKKSDKNFYVNLATNEKKWSLPKGSSKKASSLGTVGNDTGPLAVPGFGSLLAFQPSEPPAGALDAASKKKSSVVKKKKKEDSDGLSRSKSSKKSSAALTEGDLGSSTQGMGHSDNDDDNTTAAPAPPPEPNSFASSFPSILVEEASDSLSFTGSPSTSKTTKSKATSSKILKKSGKSDAANNAISANGAGLDLTAFSSPPTSSVVDGAADPSAMKKKKSSTVKKKSTKKSKKTVDEDGGPAATNDDDTQHGDDDNEDADEGEGNQGTTDLSTPPRAPAAPPPSSLSDFDDIPFTSSIMIPNTPTTQHSTPSGAPPQGIPNLSFTNAVQLRVAGGDRTPRQVSFVGDSGDDDIGGTRRDGGEGEAAPHSRAGSMWDASDTMQAPDKPLEGMSSSATVDTRRPSPTQPRQQDDETDSWQSLQALQESFSAMMTGINGTNSAATVSSRLERDDMSAGTQNQQPVYRRTTAVTDAASERLLVRSNQQQLQGDWGAIMEPIERPLGRLEQPEGRAYSTYDVRSAGRESRDAVAPAALSDGDVLHDDETASPARVASPSLTAVSALQGGRMITGGSGVAENSARWEPLGHAQDVRVSGTETPTSIDYHIADVQQFSRAATRQHISSSYSASAAQQLIDDDLLPATSPRTATVRRALAQEQRPLPPTQTSSPAADDSRPLGVPPAASPPRQQLQLSPPTSTVTTDRATVRQEQRDIASVDASAQQLLQSMDDEDDATFFRGSDATAPQIPSRGPAARLSSAVRPAGVGTGKSFVGVKRVVAAVPPPQTRNAATGGASGPATRWAGGSNGGGVSGAGSRAVTPNRQIATGPRYIQSSARYPSSFAPHRARSPEPAVTATSSRTPTPSIALPRHSRSPRASPLPSRSPSVPGHSSYPLYNHQHALPYYHDTTSQYHRASQYEPLAVIDAQHIRVASKNGGKTHNSNGSAASPRAAQVAPTPPNDPLLDHRSPGTEHPSTSYGTSSGHHPPAMGGGPPPIIIYTSPPPPTMAGWWGAPLQGGIPYTGQQRDPPHPSQPTTGVNGWNDIPINAAPNHRRNQLPSKVQPMEDRSHGRNQHVIHTASPTSTRAAVRVQERYKDACPSLMDVGLATTRPPHIPATLLGYLKPTELQQLEQLQQTWQSARDRAARLREGQRTYQALTPATKSSLEALRSRQEAQLASQTRTHDITWQYHLATLERQQ
jgi:hypothetical protein